MSRTISTSGNPPDIDGRLVDDVESLRQRIRSAVRFRLGEWFFSPLSGLDYDLLFGHTTTTGQATQLIIATIREEGGREITAIREFTFSFDSVTRVYTFKCLVDTIYGESIQVNEEL